MGRIDRQTVLLVGLLMAITTIDRCLGNVLMAATTVEPTDTFDGNSEEFFDPANQPQQSDINVFQVAHRQLEEADDQPETDIQTTIGPDRLFDHFQAVVNDTATEAIGLPDESSPTDDNQQPPTISDQVGYLDTPPSNSNLPQPTAQLPETTMVATTSTTPSTTPSTTSTPTVSIRRIKKIQTTPPPPPLKQNANEILQRLLDDQYIRSPMAALIDTSAEALRKSKMLWKAALRPQAPLDIVLVSYNSTGTFTKHKPVGPLIAKCCAIYSNAID